MSREEALKIFDLPDDYTEVDLKRRYRELADKIHPDHGGSTELMTRLNQAYEALSGRGKKRPSRPPSPPAPSSKVAPVINQTEHKSQNNLWVLALAFVLLGILLAVAVMSNNRNAKPSILNTAVTTPTLIPLESPSPSPSPSLTSKAESVLIYNGENIWADDIDKFLSSLEMTDGKIWFRVALVDQRCQGNNCRYFPYCISDTLYTAFSAQGDNYTFERIADKNGHKIFRACYNSRYTTAQRSLPPEVMKAPYKISKTK